MAFLCIYSCAPSEGELKQRQLDSLPPGVTDAAKWEKDFKDSISHTRYSDRYEADLASNKDCPVKLSVALKGTEFGSKRFDVKITNKSAKVVDAVAFTVICYDNFGDPVNDNELGMAYARMQYQKEISPGNTRSEAYETPNFSQATKGKPFVTRIHFTDGSTWHN